MDKKLTPKKKLEEMVEFCDESVNNSTELEFGQIDPSNKNNNYVLDTISKDAYSVYLINKKTISKKDLIKVRDSNLLNHSMNTRFIFYKDGENFFQRLVESNSTINTNKSLKKYSAYGIQQMILLSLLERTVAFNFKEDKNQISKFYLKNKSIDYFQPKTQRLVKGFRKFQILPVEFDYSHLTIEDGNKYRHAQDQFSKTYFFLK